MIYASSRNPPETAIPAFGRIPLPVDAGVDMTFDFPQLVAHAAGTRPLCAGSIVGSGTISNLDRSKGSCCLAEVRMLETIESGTPKTDFMKFGDRIRLEMFDASGASIFGAIDQHVRQG